MSTQFECEYERELIEAVMAEQWPDRCGTELRSHAATCEVCKDVVQVAKALHNEADTTALDVRLPSAGLVWWRAELRTRREAMRTAERPLTLVHAFAGACGVGVVAALLTQLTPWLRQSVLQLTGIQISEVAAVMLQQPWPLILTVGLLLVLAPVALYFVFSDK
jgi:hypothetical protein